MPIHHDNYYEEQDPRPVAIPEEESSEQNFEYQDKAADQDPPTPSNGAVVAQVGGSHYSKCSGKCPNCGGEIQHWDLYANHPYLEGTATGYITRWREKGGIQDLRKAISLIEKIIAVEEMAGKA